MSNINVLYRRWARLILISGRVLWLISIGLGFVLLMIHLSSQSSASSLMAAFVVLDVGLFTISILSVLFRHQLAHSLVKAARDTRRQGLALRWSYKHISLSHRETMALGLILSLGLGLRLTFLTQPIRTDEAVTYLHYASRSLPLALSNYSAPNNHLLHTFLVWISVHVFGNTEIALRLPAFLMGVLLIPITYGLGRVMANRRTGLLAAGLVAVSSVLIEYSTNARGYTLQCVLFALSIMMATSARNTLSPARWGLLAIFLALGFYTVPTMLYPFGGLMLWLLIEGYLDHQTRHVSPRQFVRAWFFCGMFTVLLTIVLYIPVLIVSGLNSIISNQYVQPFAFDVFVQHLPDAAAHLWAHWHLSIPPFIAILLSLGAVISLGKGLRGRVPLLIPCLIWSLIALAFQRVIPFERNWMPFLPLYLTSAAAGLIWIWERSFKGIALGSVVAGGLIIGLGINILLTQSPYLSIETGTFRDAKAVVQDLQPLLKPEDRVMWEHPSGDSLAYYASQIMPNWEEFAESRQTSGDLYFVLNTEYPQTLDSIARGNGVYLENYTITTMHTYPQAAILRLEHKKN